jgi:hypothetical protein
VSGLADWLRDFRDLHERARQGVLRPGEPSRYLSLRDELARTMLAAQKLTRSPGEQPRRTLRVARALQLDVEIGDARERTVTLDLSVGGFSALLARAPALGDLVGITMRLPAARSLECRARVTDVKVLTGLARVSAKFVDLPAADLERLEVFIIDTVLGMFST